MLGWRVVVLNAANYSVRLGSFGSRLLLPLGRTLVVPGELQAPVVVRLALELSICEKQDPKNL